MHSYVGRIIITSPFFQFFLFPCSSCKGGCIHYDFLSIPFTYWDIWRNQAALELPQRSCSLVLLVMPFKCRQTVLIVLRIPSVSTPGCSSPSHHNFPVASTIQHTTWSNGLNTLSGAKELGIFWYSDKSQGLISLVVSYILNMGGGE